MGHRFVLSKYFIKKTTPLTLCFLELRAEFYEISFWLHEPVGLLLLSFRK